MRKLILLALLLSFSSGCVYFNTFYHARKFFNEAEKTRRKSKRDLARGSEKTNYQKAIDKCAKVLIDHPGTSYEDDALFMMGKSYYFLAKFSKAERKFRELLSTYPDSKYADESRLFLGKSRYKLESYLLAGESFESFFSHEKKDKWRPEATYMAAVVRSAQSDNETAAEYYRRYLEDYPSHHLTPQVEYELAEIYFDGGNYVEAAALLSHSAKSAETHDLKFDALYLRGQALYAIDSVDSGLDIFLELRDDKKNKNAVPDIDLRVADGVYLLGEVSEAVILYDLATSDFRGVLQSAEAHYQMGQIMRSEFEDLQLAKEMFDLAASNGRGEEYRRMAIEQSANIAKVEQFQRDLASDQLESAISSQFMLAELFRITLDEPDSALKEYENVVNNYPGCDLAPRALIAMGYLYDHHYDDSVTAAEHYWGVIREYPYCDEYGEAVTRLGLEGTVYDSVYPTKLFEAAEEQYYDFSNSDSALALYQQLTSRFPDSRYLPQAEFAAAKIKLSRYKPRVFYTTTVLADTVYSQPDTVADHPDSALIDFEIAVDTIVSDSVVQVVADTETVSADTVTPVIADTGAVSADTGDSVDIDSLLLDILMTDSTDVLPEPDSKPAFEIFERESTYVDTSRVDSTMIRVFQQISERYQGTPIGDEAGRLARGDARERAVSQRQQRPQQQQEEEDTTTKLIAAEDADTLLTAEEEEERLRNEINELPQVLEPPTVEGEFEYPIAAYDLAFEGRITCKIKIDFDGRVTEVIILKGPNSKELEDEVNKVLLETEFDPTLIEPLNLGGYFLYFYEIQLPEFLRGQN